MNLYNNSYYNLNTSKDKGLLLIYIDYNISKALILKKIFK